MSGRVYLLGVGLALVALAFATTDRAVRPRVEPGVTEANAKRVRKGMTLQEVEAIFGRSADDGVVERLDDFRTGPLWRVWYGQDGDALVAFGEPDYEPDEVIRVVWKKNTENPSLLDRLRAWLGW